MLLKHILYNYIVTVGYIIFNYLLLNYIKQMLHIEYIVFITGSGFYLNYI